ncbi:hypothetical protein FGG08_003730 [Glutinoglossum americanum]|uniref:GED domain-containing protein n=1 Tax=Glutinoglossum americanum TaxID=1670608 RepID=A0A9P8I6K4_9PEZI|nr:hypothetical protein FGG08_003730 [Glutinoglossum americanum]
MIQNVFGSSLRGEPGEAPAAPSTIKFPPRTAEVRVEESNSKIRLQWLFPENLHWSFEEIRLVDYLQLSKETKKTTLSSTPPIDSEIDNWIREEIANNRGTELPGIPNPEVIPALFRRQTRDWASYAQQHAQAIRSIIQDSTKVLLSAICEDNAVRLNLEAKLSLFNLQAIRESEPELDSLIQDLREKPLQTYNPLFGKKIEQARRLRFNNALSRYLQQTGQLGNIYGGRMVDLDPSHLFDELHISKSRNLADDIHDTLKAYYDLEVVEFVGAVNSHITERYVTSPKGPARGFSPSWVGELPKEQLAELASESGEVIAKRKEIEGLLERLRLAEKILAEHKQGKVVQ